MPKQRGRSFSILRLLRDVFIKLDREFLQKQQAYHLAASAALPHLYGDAAELRLVLTELMTFIADRAPAGEDITVTASETLLRQVPGIEVVFSAKDIHLRGVDRHVFLHRLYGEPTAKGDDAVVLQCRKRIAARGGQLSCVLGRHHTLMYDLFLPVERRTSAEKGRHLYRYDIAIQHFMRLRKNFGIKPCTALVGRIEATIASLIRQPPDVVVANDDEGKLTVFYEGGSGGAESVASRISRKLAAEQFHVGKKRIPIAFEYALERTR
ncbi:MAG: hypothetical protein HY465_02550 [Deltaproteobacteria bacterium]|nr:hypothetical protein [Deltaproteobacteria bacterium]